jgi:pimeloyl-ACP methyl ester carboxylesterase
MIGQSMGASVAMKTAELDPSRLQAAVLIDVAGRVDPGVGAVIASEISRLDRTYESVDEHRTSAAAVAEDRAYTATQHPYERWTHLTMPILLLRATRELRPGAGFVVPVADRDRFARDVPDATVIEVDANHQTINTSDDAANAITDFLARVDVSGEASR